MSDIPVSLRRRVVERAGDRCEYCGISQLGQVATFHIDHIKPVVAGGSTSLENLALACVSCSLRKGPRQNIEDPKTKQAVAIFHPRQQAWTDHFRWDNTQVIGLTAVGRATVEALALNRPTMVAIRAEEVLLGRHPPPLSQSTSASSSANSPEAY